MIARLKRWLLAAEIRHMEADLAAIATQRKNDFEAENMIENELAIARRQLQAMIQAETQAARKI